MTSTTDALAVEDAAATSAPRARAAAMPAEERRAAIVAATLPLLLERGANVTTRQIAEAAGIAEGTIFRVFADKDDLVAAAVEAALDPAPTEAALAAIDPALGLEAQLVEAVAVIQRRLADIWRLMAAIGHQAKGPKEGHRPPDLQGLEVLFARHRKCLRTDPKTAALQLRALTLALSHPALSPDGPLAPDEVVALLLDGIRRPKR